mmetsp:Transcript_23175/g.58541  ORF Transcript_23175/g.58541 Transcript_23175/m.58541 type:complete len:531 (+) Transcript_23175:300-1892(+)|eukprot:g6781.t1
MKSARSKIVRGFSSQNSFSEYDKPIPSDEMVARLQSKLEAHVWPDVQENDKVYVQQWIRHQPRLKRFLQSCSGVDDAFEQMKLVAKSRCAYDLWGLCHKPPSEAVRNGLKTGAFIYRGVTPDGFPILWQSNRKLDCRLPERERMKAVVLVIDSLEARVDRGDFGDKRRWVILGDQSGTPQYGSPSLSFAKTLIHMTTKFYPELMLKVYVIDAGTVPHLLFAFIKPFLGEKAQKNINFVKRVKSNKSRASTGSGSSSTSASSGGLVTRESTAKPGSALDQMVGIVGIDNLPVELGGFSEWEWNEDMWEESIVMLPPLSPVEGENALNVVEDGGGGGEKKKGGRRWSRGFSVSGLKVPKISKPGLPKTLRRDRSRSKEGEWVQRQKSGTGNAVAGGANDEIDDPSKRTMCSAREQDQVTDVDSRFSSKDRSVLVGAIPHQASERKEDDIFSLHSFQTVNSQLSKDFHAVNSQQATVLGSPGTASAMPMQMPIPEDSSLKDPDEYGKTGCCGCYRTARPQLIPEKTAVFTEVT